MARHKPRKSVPKLKASAGLAAIEFPESSFVPLPSGGQFFMSRDSGCYQWSVLVPGGRRGGRRPPSREDPAKTRHAVAGDFDNRTTGSSTHFSSRPPSRYFRLQNRGAVIQALPAAS